MLWFWLAVIASFLWACSNLIGKYTLFDLNKKTMYLSILFGAGFAILATLFFRISFSIIPVIDGIFWAAAFYFYTEGLFESEVSKAIALLLTLPIFVAVISHLLLGELLGTIQYAGIVIAVIGAMLISVDWPISLKGIKFKKGAMFMLLSSLLFSTSDVLAKLSLSYVDPVSSIFLSQMTAFFIGLILLFLWKKEIKLGSGSGKLLGYALLCGVLSCVAAFLYIFAYDETLASLAAPIETTQPLFVFVLATLISIVKPEWLKENLSKENLALKIVAMLLLIAGVWLVVG
ncbi:DMT family transporter [Candidatus Micrarchaeota archaeon]|nr:DMT family transporter [Candidatus Micrarchaeota archaeon]